MKFRRRQFLQLAAGAVALPVATPLAWAQSYPTHPVRLVVLLAPGGVNDLLGRLISQWLSEQLGQPFVVENRPGGGGNIGTEMVVKSPPDGYTLLLATGANAINATLYEKLNFDFIRDIAPVASLIKQPNALLVNASFPAKTLPEFIAYAKANPGKLNMASAGTGTSSHVCGELFKMMLGLDMVHVPYRGGAPAITDLLGGQVQLYFGIIASAIENIKAGKLRALAVTTMERSDALPDVPAIAEYVPGFEASTWQGLCAPKNTPPEIIKMLNQAINKGLSDPKVRNHLADLGGTVLSLSPTEFGKLIEEETVKWGKVIKFAGIKPE